MSSGFCPWGTDPRDCDTIPHPLLPPEVCVSLPTLTQLTAKPPSCLLYLPETNQVMVRTLRWFHRWTGLGKAGVTEVNHLSLCLSVQWCLIPENTSLPPNPTLPSSITLSRFLFLISFLILGIFFFLNPFCCSLQKQLFCSKLPIFSASGSFELPAATSKSLHFALHMKNSPSVKKAVKVWPYYPEPPSFCGHLSTSPHLLKAWFVASLSIRTPSPTLTLWVSGQLLEVYRTPLKVPFFISHLLIYHQVTKEPPMSAKKEIG